MATRSDQNNPEQKTKIAGQTKTEFSKELDPVEKAKQKYAKQGQPIKSKQHPEN
ncbi:glycogen biosynthesis protein GlgD [Bacillus sp. FJAT-42376]|uniref:glycogen biosynthesis protein GlgD n=1 Tax=Bacillus sp. FJAT-42376 TaxID=2014076 RepID=UPI000F4FB7AA|nr:glycogen biosynthesis protein GlgD [Bacillus sp. FJAT-42376]AZB44047.1 glycogen biosynthesis protein GlgD [Bacillus sp. FJAT-42376]